MGEPTITINNVQRNEGCLGGCGSLLGVVLLLGLAIEYWYISAGLALLALAGGVSWFAIRERTPLRAPVQPAPAPASVVAGAACRACGRAVQGPFCHHCGAAQTRTCAGCGKTGFDSPFCPECGAATFVAPTAA